MDSWRGSGERNENYLSVGIERFGLFLDRTTACSASSSWLRPRGSTLSGAGRLVVDACPAGRLCRRPAVGILRFPMSRFGLPSRVVPAEIPPRVRLQIVSPSAGHRTATAGCTSTTDIVQGDELRLISCDGHNRTRCSANRSRGGLLCRAIALQLVARPDVGFWSPRETASASPPSGSASPHRRCSPMAAAPAPDRLTTPWRSPDRTCV